MTDVKCRYPRGKRTCTSAKRKCDTTHESQSPPPPSLVRQFCVAVRAILQTLPFSFNSRCATGTQIRKSLPNREELTLPHLLDHFCGSVVSRLKPGRRRSEKAGLEGRKEANLSRSSLDRFSLSFRECPRSPVMSLNTGQGSVESSINQYHASLVHPTR